MSKFTGWTGGCSSLVGPRRRWPALRAAAWSVPLFFAALSAPADELFRDEFNDGVIPPRYTVFGGATMIESGGRLIVTMPDSDSGFTIDIEDFPTQACFKILYNIAYDGFPVGTELRHSWISPSITIPGLDFEAIGVTLFRPFWNRCTYTVTQGDNAGGPIGFTGPYTEGKECPAADCITLDWVSDDPPTFQVEIKGDFSMFKKSKRVSGMEYEASVAPEFTHHNNQIKCYKVTKTSNNLLPAPPVVMSIDMLVLDSQHQGDAAQSVQMSQDVFDRGELTQVAITTDRPFLVPGLTTLTMGAEVMIHDFQIFTPTQASAVIQIDERARNGGHWVILETNDFLLSSDFTIRPLDVNAPLPANEAPVAQVMAPTFVGQGQPFTIDTTWDDSDDQFIQGLVVVQELPSTAEVFDAGYFFIDTSGSQPVLRSFIVPGLPAGMYKVIAVPNDGLATEVMIASTIFVGLPPANDACADAIAIGEGIFPYNNAGANTDGPSPCGAMGRDIWYLYTACNNGTATASTCSVNRTYDTVLAVHNAPCVGSLVGCNDDGPPSCANPGVPFSGSTVAFPTLAGQQYLIQVGGFAGAQGASDLTISHNNCALQNGACCCGSSCTNVASAALCVSPGGGITVAFVASGNCNPFGVTTPCCRADFNRSGGNPSPQDVFDFLAAFFSPTAAIRQCADFNGNPPSPFGVSPQDVFDFLAAFFRPGGCTP